MKRLLFLLAACGSAPQPKPQPKPVVTVATWFERWTEARACLVGPTQDLPTGVTTVMQSGKDCSRFVARLDTEVAVQTVQAHDGFPVLRTLVQALQTQQLSPSKRIELIQSVDVIVEGIQSAERGK